MADIIDTLAALDDAALMEKIGLSQQLADVRTGLADMSKLDGDARKEAVSRVESMLKPNVWPGEFKHIAKSAQRTVARKDAVAEMCDCSPCSVLDD